MTTIHSEIWKIRNCRYLCIYWFDVWMSPFSAVMVDWGRLVDRDIVVYECLLKPRCCKASNGVNRSVASHSKHRVTKSTNSGSWPPFRTWESCLDPGGPRYLPRADRFLDSLHTLPGVCWNRTITRVSGGAHEMLGSLATVDQWLRWQAEQLHDARNLVALVTTNEQWRAVGELGQSASKAPHIDRQPNPSAEKHFRCSDESWL